MGIAPLGPGQPRNVWCAEAIMTEADRLFIFGEPRESSATKSKPC